jgi:hypothetical protein
MTGVDTTRAGVRHSYRVNICQMAAGGIMEDYRPRFEERDEATRLNDEKRATEWDVAAPEDEVPFHIPRD